MPPRARARISLALAAAFACACGASRANIIEAIITSSVAAGASAERRAGGDCFVPCGFGTVCNPNTGYCDRQPCGGSCAATEICVESGGSERCEAVPVPDLSVQRRPGAAPPPPSPEVPAAQPAPPAPPPSP